jgi:trk system potassium uptake protein TrkA
MREHMPHIDTRVAAIFRHDRPIRPQGSTIVEAGDEVFFIAASQHIRAVMSELQRLEKPYKRIMLVGGGNIGAGLAHRLEKDYSVKLIERDQQRALNWRKNCKIRSYFMVMRRIRSCWLKSILIKLIFYCRHQRRRGEYNVRHARETYGGKKVMVLIQRKAYVDLVQGSVIDIAISPQQATISALLSHVRKADIVGVSSLRRGVAEAIEAVAHGDETTSRVVGRSIDEIKLPPGTIIGAVVRGNDVMIANDNLRIEQGDHVIMFLTDKKFITDVERLFQPSPFFL